MSSSKVLTAVQLAATRVPIGSHEFIERFRREQEESSPEGRRRRELEERHQRELQQTRTSAYQQGEAAGLQKGLAKSQQIENEMRQAITALVNYQKAVYEQARRQTFELAFALADKITSARGETEQQTVIDTINRCISEFLDKSRLVIRVNPAQAEFVRQQLGAVAALNDSTAHVAVETDTRVGPGGCIVETDSGSADARFETQLEILKTRLLELA